MPDLNEWLASNECVLADGASVEQLEESIRQQKRFEESVDTSLPFPKYFGSPKTVVIDIKEIYGETAKLDALADYEAAALQLAGSGNAVTLTGAGPVWLYLRLGHALHGKALSLHYDSPVTGPVEIFNHNPF